MRAGRSLTALAVVAVCWSPAAHAYRPFEGTDAGVAEPGMFELELGPLGYVKAGKQKSVVAPAAVANYGIGDDTEIVLEGRVTHLLGDLNGTHRTSLEGTALSLKHVLRHGSLQDGAGVSVATECGVLLPEFQGTSRVGATCSGIVSQRWDAAAVHINTALTRTRDQTVTRFLGVIVEGPQAWPVRPVMEVFTEHENNGLKTNSAQVGFIWKYSEALAFDSGFRKARADGQNLTEVRLGLTWSVELHK